jgi:hypothetical protein
MTRTTSDRVRLNSSTLAAAAYDPVLAKLELDFCDGTRYLYSGVGSEIYHGLLGAVSTGVYFNRHIRGHFPYARLPIEN